MDKSRLKSIAREAATDEIASAEERLTEMLDAEWVQIAVFPEEVSLEAEVDGMTIEIFVPVEEL